MDYRHFFENVIGVQKIRWSGNQGIGRCPLPNHEDRNQSFSMNESTGQCKCFGCDFKGNAYTLAKTLNKDNPRQWIDSSTIDSNNYTSIEYKPINTIKSHSEGIDEVGIMEKYEELKERYGNRINLREKIIMVRLFSSIQMASKSIKSIGLRKHQQTLQIKSL